MSVYDRSMTSLLLHFLLWTPLCGAMALTDKCTLLSHKCANGGFERLHLADVLSYCSQKCPYLEKQVKHNVGSWQEAWLVEYIYYSCFMCN